eukprot:Rmarinus@m.9176
MSTPSSATKSSKRLRCQMSPRSLPTLTVVVALALWMGASPCFREMGARAVCCCLIQHARYSSVRRVFRRSGKNICFLFWNFARGHSRRHVSELRRKSRHVPTKKRGEMMLSVDNGCLLVTTLPSGNTNMYPTIERIKNSGEN